MARKNQELVISKYRDLVSRSTDEVLEIIRRLELNIPNASEIYSDLLDGNANKMVGKWKKGEKYVRTEFVLEAFGSEYPEEVLPISIFVDSMINILDDLLDEDLSKEDKIFYILEYLRVFSLYSGQFPSKEIQQRVSLYFMKVITLAVAERVHLGLVENESDIRKISDLSSDLLITRAMDIDVFVDIVFVIEGLEIDENVQVAGRCFRALNILKKDLLDLEHDLSGGQETLVTLVYKNQDMNNSEYLACVVESFKAKIDGIKGASGALTPVEGFARMFDREVLEIEKLSSGLS